MRVKDKHAAWLSSLGREVNTVFNYCNELSMKVFERERRFLSGYDFWPFLKGATRGDCALNLPVQAVQEIAEEYARRRRQNRKLRLAWRKSRGVRRSLGWIPFKVRTIRYNAGQVYFAGRWLSLWDSFGLKHFELRAGNFSEDARGRWYLNVCVPSVQRSGREPPVESILNGTTPSLGIDLGLKQFAAFSDASMAPIEAKRFYRDLQLPLARAQRAHKKQRARAIHAKISNRRKDFLHKLANRLVIANGAIFIGDSMPLLWPGLIKRSRYLMRGGVPLELCFGTNALTQTCGSMKSMKRFLPRPAACVTAAPAPKAGKVLE